MRTKPTLKKRNHPTAKLLLFRKDLGDKRKAIRSPERLCEFVRRIRNEKGLSLIDVSKQSAIFGPSISGSYINRIERNPKVKVTLDKLTALAHGLGIPVEEMFAHAVRTMSRDEADELSLVTRFKELPPNRQADVWSILLLWHSEDLSTECKGTSNALSDNETDGHF